MGELNPITLVPTTSVAMTTLPTSLKLLSRRKNNESMIKTACVILVVFDTPNVVNILPGSDKDAVGLEGVSSKARELMYGSWAPKLNCSPKETENLLPENSSGRTNLAPTANRLCMIIAGSVSVSLTGSRSVMELMECKSLSQTDEDTRTTVTTYMYSSHIKKYP